MALTGMTAPCSTRSPGSVPTSAQAASRRARASAVTQCTATGRPSRCARSIAATRAGSVGRSWSPMTTLAGPRASSSSTARPGAPVTTTRWGIEPSATPAASRLGPPGSVKGVASVTPVTPWAVRAAPTSARWRSGSGHAPPRRSSPRRIQPRTRSSSLKATPAAATAVSAAPLRIQRAPEASWTRTGTAPAQSSSRARSRSTDDGTNPVARTHRPGRVAPAARRMASSATAGGERSSDPAAAAMANRCRWWSCSPGTTARPSTSSTSWGPTGR